MELSALFRDQPETALERAVFWTEYVIRHKGAKQLRTAARKLNSFQYHNLDVVLFIMGCFMVLTGIILCIHSAVKSVKFNFNLGPIVLYSTLFTLIYGLVVANFNN